MKYSGRILVVLTVILTITAWHASYFLINQSATYTFLIKNRFLRFDFIYTPLTLPFFWWIGKKYDEATFYSQRDPLTSLYNRRYVIGIFPSLLERARIKSKELSIFVIDVDNFKQINDTLGHDVGDAVLKSISLFLLKCVDEHGLVARWGGDEFLIVLRESNCFDLQSLLTEIESSLIHASNEFEMSISVSVGMASYNEQVKGIDDLIRVADKQMYTVKAGKKVHC